MINSSNILYYINAMATFHYLNCATIVAAIFSSVIACLVTLSGRDPLSLLCMKQLWPGLYQGHRNWPGRHSSCQTKVSCHYSYVILFNSNYTICIITRQVNKKFYCRTLHVTVLIKHLHYYNLNIVSKTKLQTFLKQQICSELGTCKINYRSSLNLLLLFIAFQYNRMNVNEVEEQVYKTCLSVY